ncbi:MAG: 2-succinyl-6-hydroxy-2,4-cyclohexadiene-1-carboxylate synthase [Chloroflexota bacterium]|nr:2-succinyl-6-hydroxy-2,4-cyclohexadiene-1-carboxylate synthase [Chloroflexota bacterium]MDE2948745.1 2-succinyl-6-hydroxy-2,4-cyclohexadiene-1-carboxylate synthase [Chloroflexota bacterium]
MTRYRAAPSGHHYNIEISGAGHPLLLLHGFTGDASTWRSVAARLAGDFQFVAIDLIGHGASDAPADQASYRMEAVAADLIALLDCLAINDAHLLGYSMGGRLALFTALHYPARFRSLILESASPGLADETDRAQRRRRDNDLADRIEACGLDWFVDHWEKLPLWASQSEDLLRRQRRQRLTNDPTGLANSLRAMGAGAQPNLWRQLPNLTLPTCLIVGERDEKFRRINQAIDAALPKSGLAIIPSAGHNTHLENPKAFRQTLRSFLAAV